ncbi:MAG: hypothetical protein GXO35_07575 [Gammaproteobacteria bacterium]|nr:hypothetical protein [Gammaproteobacteria bacterium]
MTKLKLNSNRTTVITVPIENESGEILTFKATIKILGRKATIASKSLIEDMLVSVDGYKKIIDPDGKIEVSIAEELEAVLDDSVACMLIMQAFNMGNEKLLKKSRTYTEQLET